MGCSVFENRPEREIRNNIRLRQEVHNEQNVTAKVKKQDEAGPPSRTFRRRSVEAYARHCF